MKMNAKSFPLLQLFLIFLIFFFQFCKKEEALTVNKEQFIEIYARLLIINELRVERPVQDRLIQELYKMHNVTATEIDSTISYYNSKPREWVEIYNLVREKIQNIKNEYKTDSSKKVDSLISKSKSKISTKSFEKSFIGDDADKKLKSRQNQKESKEKGVKRGDKKSD
jgi:hypothetical protein